MSRRPPLMRIAKLRAPTKCAAVLAVNALAVCMGHSAEARVVKISIDSRSAMAGGRSLGAAGAYEILRGRAFGEVDPTDPHDAIIQDIELAARNDRGMVEYIATFTIIKPIDAHKGNGVLLDRIPNRGTSLHPFFDIGNDSEDTFIYERGYTILSSGWQGDLTPVPTAHQSSGSIPIETIAVPRAKNLDGSPITGPFLIRIPTLGPSGPTGDLAKLDQGRGGPLSYEPASLDPGSASLVKSSAETIRGIQTGKTQRIASTDWIWADCETGKAPVQPIRASSLCIRLLKDRFDPTQVYTFRFVAKDPLVLGLGFAATRDVASFFRYNERDDSGAANPIIGTTSKAIGQGASQTGNFVKAFIHLGFNEDEAGRVVWDGANAHIAGRFAPINFRFAVPGGSATLYAPGSEATLWWGPAQDRFRGKATTASMLDRCRSTVTCPKVFETFGSSEFWNQRMSLGLVGSDARHDIDLPPEVRRYYFPGTTHGGGDGGFGGVGLPANESAQTGACVLPANPNSEKETMRALLVALTGWVTKDTPPPDSNYPTLRAGLLVEDKNGIFEFPLIPGVRKPYGLVNPLIDYDFGSHFNTHDLSGYIDNQPPIIRQVLPTLVPTVDADGNETSGVASVLHQAPLGTYLGWNITRAGVFSGQICSLNGGFVPFARTRAERVRTGDGRLSLVERYGNRQGYVCAVEYAAQRAVTERFLLTQDAQRLVGEATVATSSGDLAFLPSTPSARGQALCIKAQATALYRN